MNGYFLFIDTETSGLPPPLDTPINDLPSWPNILQIAWEIYHPNGECISSENHYIFDDTVSIEAASQKVHGITKEDLAHKGEQRKRVMILLNRDLKKYKPIIVGHFVDFDIKMVQVAMMRAGIKHRINKLKKFCTMRATSEYTRFPNQNYPLLGDLYLGLFGEKLQNEHDAAQDVAATAKCFFKLYTMGQITGRFIKSQTSQQKRHRTVAHKSGCGIPVLLLLLLVTLILST